MDGYPRSYKDSIKILTKRKPVFNEEGEEEPQEEEKKVVEVISDFLALRDTYQ